MDLFINAFAFVLGNLTNIFYNIVPNYALAILLLTLASKIILFPINILVHKNSIKMVKIKPQIEEIKMQYENDKEKIMEKQVELFDEQKYHPSLGTIPLLIQIPIILGLLKVVNNPENYINNIKNYNFLWINMSNNPCKEDFYIIPILACLSTLLLCFVQNRVNVLQKEETFVSKLITTTLTTALTIYFVFIVPNGVGLYWIFGNILSIFQLFLLNKIYPPSNYIDYEAFDKIKKLKQEKAENDKICKKRSKEDYKKLINASINNEIKLVFYSEQNGFYKYYKGIIEYILKNSEIKIHYITSDINDNIFKMDNPQILPFFVATNQLIPLFMKLEADMVVMTTPDLDNLYLKRSIVKKDIEYVFTDHAINSVNLSYNTGALDHYDTIFLTGFKEKEELLALETLRKTKPKKYVETGYCFYDELVANYNSKNSSDSEKTILIAPSWQKDNIMDLCINRILKQLVKSDYKTIIRPHPQFMKFNKEKLFEIQEKFKEEIEDGKIVLEKDFSSNDSIYNADIVITDWSSIAFEYSFTTLKPTLYVDTPMKVINKEYKKIDIEPMDIELRNIIGKSIKIEEIPEINTIINDLISSKESYEEKIKNARDKYLYNFGQSSEVSGKYIIDSINSKTKKKGE